MNADEVKSKQYEDRIVLFADILGFSELVDQLDQNPERIEELIDVFGRISTAFDGINLENRKRVDLQFSNFSDCVLLSCKTSETNLTHMVHAAQILSVALLATGYLSRGALAVGKMFHQSNALFGRALVEAYKLESSVARYPRILIAPSALIFVENRLSQDIAPTDADGLRHINIFQREFFDGHRDHFKEGYSYTRMMEVIGNVLKEKAKGFGSNIDATTIERKSKVVWLVNFYNTIASRYSDTSAFVIR